VKYIRIYVYEYTERMFASKLRLSPAATMSDDTPSALTLSLHGASFLQPAASPQIVSFES